MTAERANWLLLGACLLLALALRAPWLDRVPGPLHPDEAQDAVHARDVLVRPALTFAHEGGGRDEGTYVWLAAPCVGLADALGWPPIEAAVRAPALLAGLALVLAVFLLARECTPRVALLAALIVATTPWAVHLSRMALRAALVPPLVVLGLWCLDRAARADDRRAMREAALGGLLLALAAATYTPARLVVPPLAALWLATAVPRPSRGRAALALGPAVGVLLLLLPWTLAGGGAARLEQVLALEREGPVLEQVARAARGWAVHLSTRFLFSGATSRGFAPEGVGLLPLSLAPRLLVGLADVARGAWRRERAAARLLGWVALAPAAAALTRDLPNALRAVLMLPALALLAARGADALVARVPRPRRRAALLALAALIVTGAAPSLWRYATEHPAREAAFYYAGRRELARYIAARVEAGEAVRVEGELIEAYLRLYAPTTPLRREDGALVAGSAAPRWLVRADRDAGRWTSVDLR